MNMAVTQRVITILLVVQWVAFFTPFIVSFVAGRGIPATAFVALILATQCVLLSGGHPGRSPRLPNPSAK
jgi:hypothetical protein